MLNLKDIQSQVWANKLAKGFNTTDIEKEFNLTYAELAEAYEAYRKQLGNVGEELADVLIYLLSLAKMFNVDLEKEVLAKVEVNRKREYKAVGAHKIRTKEA